MSPSRRRAGAALISSSCTPFTVDREDGDEILATDEELAEIGTRLEAEGIPHSIHDYVRGNDPAKDLVIAAREFGGELIVIGIRRRTAAGKFLLGSNAHDILMDADCPVLTVKAGSS